MESIRQYILSVISIALLCSFVQLLFQDDHHAGLVKVITGLMVTLTVISPLCRTGSVRLEQYFATITSDGSWAVEEGQTAAEHTIADIIKDRTSAYICDKASTFGASIDVDVELTGTSPPTPSRIIVKGDASPYVKKQLTEYIHKEFDISEEDQLWIS